MPKVTRRRTVSAPPTAVWELISDPYNLPRWWPRTSRVENVDPDDGVGRRWTTVLSTAEGRGVRADYRCTVWEEGEGFAWEQEVEGTPFARHLRRAGVEAALGASEGGTEVSLSANQTLRGMSRLGAPMMRRGQGAMLDEALDGIERALAGDGEPR